MAGCVALTDVNLSYNKELTAAGLEPFCASPPPQLEKLNLMKCELDGKQAMVSYQHDTNLVRFVEYPLSIGLLKAGGCKVYTGGNPKATLVGDIAAIQETTKLDYSSLNLKGKLYFVVATRHCANIDFV